MQCYWVKVHWWILVRCCELFFFCVEYIACCRYVIKVGPILRKESFIFFMNVKTNLHVSPVRPRQTRKRSYAKIELAARSLWDLRSYKYHFPVLFFISIIFFLPSLSLFFPLSSFSFLVIYSIYIQIYVDFSIYLKFRMCRKGYRMKEATKVKWKEQILIT